MTVDVGIYGATGYTGLELARLLEAHPDARIRFVTSESAAGTSLRASHPLAPDLPLVSSQDAPLDGVELVFLCLPHTQSAPIAACALERGLRVIDLSADLRIDDPAVYEQWYRVPHPAPDLLPAPYGLPELNRLRLLGAECVANPGCYATALLLATVPLAHADLFVTGAPLIIDAKSGVTGAGRSAKQHLLFGEVQNNLSPYNIGRAHRHLAEVEQELARAGYDGAPPIFVPHLLPTDRGILAAIYAQVTDLDAAQDAIRQAYSGEPLVCVLPPGEVATLAHVVRSPRAVLSLTPAEGNVLIIMSALDNLLKGAASQAVQNFNLMMSFRETAGLLPA